MFQTITVLPLASSVRLDSFLVEQFPQTSRTFWKKHLSEIILVDNRRGISLFTRLTIHFFCFQKLSNAET